MPATKPRLKIAYVVHDYNRHMGHSRYVAELASRLKHEHEIHVFSNTFEEPDPAGITYHHIPAVRTTALTTILSFILPATILVRGRFDVIHSQGLCGLRHNVATTHFCQPRWDESLMRGGGRLTWRQWLSRTLVTPLERLAIIKRSTRRVIAISELVRQDLARFYGREDGVSVIYHGVDLEHFNPRNRFEFRDRLRADLGVSPETCLALFVGYLQKGGATAIRAVARVEGVRLVLVSGSDQSEARGIARSEGIEDRVIFMPFSRQVERYYAAADLFIYPTIYETYGMVISEAMASGLPVITTREAGASELIDHGVNGWLAADAWDVDQFAEGLRALAVDSSYRERMGSAARSTMEAHTWDDAARQTLDVYREMVEASPRHSNDPDE